MNDIKYDTNSNYLSSKYYDLRSKEIDESRNGKKEKEGKESEKRDRKPKSKKESRR